MRLAPKIPQRYWQFLKSEDRINYRPQPLHCDRVVHRNEISPASDADNINAETLEKQAGSGARRSRQEADKATLPA